MNRHCKKILALVFGIFAICGVLIGSNQPAYARTQTQIQQSIMDKAIFQGIYHCYTDGYVNSEIDPLSKYTGIQSFVSSKKSGENYVPLVSGANSKDIWTVSRYMVGDGGVSCKQLFNGGAYAFGGSNVDLLKAFNRTAPSINKPDEVVAFVENMGYAVDTSIADECYALKYSLYSSATQKTISDVVTHQVCKDSSGNLYSEGDSGSQVRFTVSTPLFSSKKQLCLMLAGSSQGCTDYTGTFNGEWLMGVVKNACGGMECSVRTGAQDYRIDYTFKFDASIDSVTTGANLANASASFINNSGSDAALQAIRFLSGDAKFSSPDTIKIDTPEKTLLYQAYLTSYYGVEVNCTTGESDAAYDGSITWYDVTSMSAQSCHYGLAKAKNKNKAVNGIVSGDFSYGSIRNLDALLKEFETMPTEYTQEEQEEINNIVNGGGSQSSIEGNTSINGSGSTSDSDLNACQKSGGVFSLGWWICPIINTLIEASKTLYADLLEPRLFVEPELFTSSQGETYQAWNDFRNFANIVFVIMILVIVFSQLTGVGIDNYGIKRTLPKLIVAAILVNLSYIICQVCVDLSNIVGNSMLSFFNGLSPATVNIDVNGASHNIGGTLVGTALIGVIAGFGVWTALGITGLLSVLVSAVVSLFFLFILLAAREAAIVVLVVLSPLAFVCYMLPNTKQLFNKWMKLGEGLLLVYPISGLLVGGGSYVSKLLLAVNGGGGFFDALAAIIVSIIPIFFIPTVLKNSFSALGNLGAKISGFGQRMGGGATRAMRASNAFKSLDRMSAEHKTRRYAGIDKDGNARKLSAFGRFIRGGTRNVAANRAQYLKDQDTTKRAQRLAGADGIGFEAARVAQEKGAERDETSDYMTLINARTDNGENTKAFDDIVADYARGENKAGLVAAARIAGRRKDTATDFFNKYMRDGAISNEALRKSVAKEIATGENSGTYMGAAPLAFEYAAQMNKGTQNGGIDINTSYDDWLKDKGNINTALKNYVNNNKELLGMKGKSLGELADIMEGKKTAEDGSRITMEGSDKAKIQRLAQETIANHEKHGGPWEADKVEQLARLAGGEAAGYKYDETTNSIMHVTPQGGGTTAAQEGQGVQLRGSADDAGGDLPIHPGEHAPSRNNGGGGATVVEAGGAPSGGTGGAATVTNPISADTVQAATSGRTPAANDLAPTPGTTQQAPVVRQVRVERVDNSSQQIRTSTPSAPGTQTVVGGQRVQARSQNQTTLADAARNGNLSVVSADGRRSRVTQVTGRPNNNRQ